MVQIDKTKCIGCGACVRDCPREILELRDNRAERLEDSCILCGHCYCVCPTEAIGYEPEDDVDGSIPLADESWRLDPEAFLAAIKGRRSVRLFRDQPVEKEKLERVLEAARFTPTGANREGTGLIVIQDRLEEVTEKCLEIMYHAARHPEEADTPMLPFYKGRWIRMRWEYKKRGTDRLFYHAGAVVVFTGGDEIDTAMAAANAEMMVSAEGLGCVHVGFCRYAFNTPEMRELLQIPADREEVCTLAIGYPAVTYRRTAPRRKKEVLFL